MCRSCISKGPWMTNLVSNFEFLFWIFFSADIKIRSESKHKEAFSTLVESLVQMTCSEFIIFFKLAKKELAWVSNLYFCHIGISRFHCSLLLRCNCSRSLSDKLQTFALENSGKCTYLQKNVKSRCRLGYSAEKHVLYGKFGQSK